MCLQRKTTHCFILQVLLNEIKEQYIMVETGQINNFKTTNNVLLFKIEVICNI